VRTGDIETAIRLELGKQSMTGNDLADTLKRRVDAVRKALRAMKARGELIEFDRKWHLDGPMLRWERVQEVIGDEKVIQSTIATITKLAKVAHVSVEDVTKFVTEGRLARTSEGDAGAWYAPVV